MKVVESRLLARSDQLASIAGNLAVSIKVEREMCRG